MERLPEKIMEVEKAMCSFTELINQRRRVAAAKSRDRKREKEYVGTTLSQDSGYSSTGSQESLSHLGGSSLDDELFRTPDGPVFLQVLDEDSGKCGGGHSGGSVRMDRQIRGKITDFNSLSLLCRRFLMVLLCAPVRRNSVSSCKVNRTEWAGFSACWYTVFFSAVARKGGGKL